MATTEREDEVEYESDPDDTKRSLVMRRRRVASDDEEEEERAGADGGRDGEDGGDVEGEKAKRVDRVQPEDSDGEGAVAEHDDDEEAEEYYLEGEDDDYEEGEGGYDEEGVEVVDSVVVADDVVVNERVVDRRGSEHVEERVRKEMGGASGAMDTAGEWGDDNGEGEEEGNLEGKKENEPFAVPTDGTFYMHDDRFRDSVGGRNRRSFGRRKLWESNDDRKWGHDKFEEITVRERWYDERRRGRGNYRGRGRNRAVDHGYPRGYRTKSYDDTQTVTSTNNSYQNQVARSVRGRGPRRFETSLGKSNRAPSNQSKQSTKSTEEYLQDNAVRSVVSSMSRVPDTAPVRKQTLASSLNSASPPFYLSITDASSAQRKEVQVSNANRINRPPIVDDHFSVREPNAPVQGKNIANSVGLDKLSIDDSFAASVGQPVRSMPIAPVSGSHPLQNQNRAQGQGRDAAFPVGTMTYQPISQGQVGRASPSMRVNYGQKSSMSSRIHITSQEPGKRPGSGQRSSPSKVSASVNSSEILDTDFPSDSSKLAGALVPKGKATVQGSGRGSFVFGGPQVVGAGGNAGVGLGDQNFPGTPAFLPVMQLGGQHPGGHGVPAVGMAFPGYVAQPQLGMGNSEMAWLPVLAGATGALGAYCPPYIAVDGAYHTSSGETTSTSSSSKESHLNKPNNEWKPAQRPGTRREVVNEDNGHRQNKPRRFSEMNCGQ